MSIVRYKSLSTEDTFKGISKAYSAKKSAYGDSGADQALTWYLIERSGTVTDKNWTAADDDMRNLFMSFGLSRADVNEYYRFVDSFDIYNGKRMLIATIPQSGCGTYIDGSTLRLNVPIGTAVTEFTTFYGSSYAGYLDKTNGLHVSNEYDDGIYGCASIYLFADTSNPLLSGSLPTGTFTSGQIFPYTGTIDGSINPNSGKRSWDPDNDDATYTWTTAEAKMNIHLRATHASRNPDDGYDIPYGIAFLERGVFVIFDTYTSGREDFIANTNAGSAQTIGSIWSGNDVTFQAITYTAGTKQPNTNTANRKNVRFTGSVAHESAKLTYRTVTKDHKMIYFCQANMGEFNFTDNPTYNHKMAYYREDDSASIYVTEIGLFDDSDTLLAYAKLSEPVEKNKLETLSFKVSLEL